MTTMTLPVILVYIVIGAICAAFGKLLLGDIRGGFIIAVAIGFIGALIGPWISQKFSLPEPFKITLDRHSFGILWSIICAAVFVAIIHLFFGR